FRRPYRPVCDRTRLPAAVPPGVELSHPLPFDRRPLPRALAHLRFRERRRPRDLHRQRRPDGAQPRSPRRSALPDPRSADPALPPLRAAAGLPARRHARDDAEERRAVRADPPRRRRIDRRAAAADVAAAAGELAPAPVVSAFRRTREVRLKPDTTWVLLRHLRRLEHRRVLLGEAGRLAEVGARAEQDLVEAHAVLALLDPDGVRAALQELERC